MSIGIPQLDSPLPDHHVGPEEQAVIKTKHPTSTARVPDGTVTMMGRAWSLRRSLPRLPEWMCRYGAELARTRITPATTSVTARPNP